MTTDKIEIFRCTLLIDGKKKYGYNIAVADLDEIETESHEIDDNIYFWCNGKEEFEDMVKNGCFDFQILDYEQIEYESAL